MPYRLDRPTETYQFWVSTDLSRPPLNIVGEKKRNLFMSGKLLEDMNMAVVSKAGL
jgi:hypothetical protein